MIEKALVIVVTGALVGMVNSIAGGGMLIGFPVFTIFWSIGSSIQCHSGWSANL
ncbi:MAG: hypothetical protein WDN66_05565 [Candidatus Saccharibacteria bacterium]